VWYISKSRKKFHTRVGVAMSLGLVPYSRLVKTMPRYIIAALAIETRERFLISELTFAHPSPHLIREFVYSPTDDQISVKSALPLDPDQTAAALPPPSLPSSSETSLPSLSEAPLDSSSFYFSCGNTTVLDWGRVIPNGFFHSRHEIFPLGFKSIRQEYDELLNCLVDCLCEIDYYSITSPTRRYSRQELEMPLRSDVKSDIRPLFRITVAWETGGAGAGEVTSSNHQILTKVYEGKSPQFVWQLILIDRVGLPGEATEPLGDELLFIEEEGGIAGETMTELESEDDEERVLRSQLMELRKQYVKSVSHAQVLSSPLPP
jgi:hypothetical protein